MTDTRIYLGRPGALAALRSPRGTFEATRQRRVATFDLGLGGVSVDQMVGGARTYTINYDQLFREDWTTLQAYLDGLEGPGPFALLDPGQRNMLPANIAGATSVTNSPDGSGAPVGGFDLLGVADDYNRAAVASGWGTMRTGQTWAASPAGSHAATGTGGTQVLAAVGSFYTATVETSSTNFDITADVSLSVASALGASVSQWVCGRYADSSNYYTAQLALTTTGTVTLSIFRRAAGSLSAPLGAVGTLTVGTGHAAGDIWRVRFIGTGTSLTAYAWLRDSGVLSTSNQVTATDATLTTGTGAALLTRLETSNTNGVVVATWDNFAAEPMWATLTSSATYTDAGPRSLALNFSAAPTGSGGSIALDWPSSTFGYGVPVVAGRALCFSCWVRGGGTDAIVTYTPRIIWRDATGAVVSTTTGTPVASSSGAFTQMFAQAVPPGTAVYADPDLLYTSGASAGSIGYFRRLLLNEGTTPDTAWTVGTGVWPVRMVAGAEAWPFLSPELRAGPVVSFIEDVS